MFRATVSSDRATYISADAEHPKEIVNSAGAKLFRKTARDVDSGDTELAAGASVTITDGHFLVSASKSEITVRDVKVAVSQDVKALGDISSGDDITVGDKLIVEGEAELNGDLNHDGTKVGFFGTAPAAQPDIKPANEVTAKEIGEALVTLGLIK